MVGIRYEMVEKDWKWSKNNTKWSKRIENYAKLFKKDRKWWKDQPKWSKIMENGRHATVVNNN